MHCAQSPVVLFRRRLMSVSDVLKGIRSKGFYSVSVGCSFGFWEAVCRHGPCGPISSLEPWDRWVLADLHGFYKWVFDSLELLNDFLKQVVVSRRKMGFVSGSIGFGRIKVLGVRLTQA